MSTNPPKDFLAAWRTQLGLSGSGSGSRRYKVTFLLAVEAGVTDKTTLDVLIVNLGLYATPAKPLAQQTLEHLATLGAGSDNLRRELGELVPVDERPHTAAVQRATDPA